MPYYKLLNVIIRMQNMFINFPVRYNNIVIVFKHTLLFYECAISDTPFFTIIYNRRKRDR